MSATNHHAHTCGPFSLVEEGGDLLIVAPDPETPEFFGIVAQVFDCDFPQQALANGQLLSASADLLLELKTLIAALQPSDAIRYQVEVQRGLVAIAKAEAPL